MTNDSPTLSDEQYAQQARDVYAQGWAFRKQVSDHQILQRQKQNATLGDYLTDIPTGAVEGVGKAVASVGDLLDHATGGSGTEANPLLSTTHNTWTGDVSSAVAEFATAYMAPGSIAGKIGSAYKLSKGAKAGLGLVAGGVADFAGFTGDGGRLADLVESHPILSNPVSRFLASDPSDSWAEKRLKGALEGMGLGAATEVLFHTLRGVRAAKGGDATVAAEARASLEKIAEEHPGFFDGTDTGALAPAVRKDVTQAFEKPLKMPDVPPTALPKEVLNAEQPRQPFSGPVPDQLAPPTELPRGSVIDLSAPQPGSLRSPLTPPEAPTAVFKDGSTENLANVLC